MKHDQSQTRPCPPSGSCGCGHPLVVACTHNNAPRRSRWPVGHRAGRESRSRRSDDPGSRRTWRRWWSWWHGGHGGKRRFPGGGGGFHGGGACVFTVVGSEAPPSRSTVATSLGPVFHGGGYRYGGFRGYHAGGYRYATHRHHFHRRFYYSPSYYYAPHRYCRSGLDLLRAAQDLPLSPVASSPLAPPPASPTAIGEPEERAKSIFDLSCPIKIFAVAWPNSTPGHPRLLFRQD